MAVTRRETTESQRRKYGKAYRYQVKWRFGGDGAQQSVTVASEDRARRIDTWVAEQDRMVLRDDPRLLHLMNEGVAAPDAKAVPVETFLARWYESRVAKGLRESSLRCHRSELAHLRSDAYGDLAAKDARMLTSADIVGVLAAMARDGKSVTYRRMALKTWRRALKASHTGSAAVRTDDPFAEVEVPGTRSKRHTVTPVFLSDDEQRILLDAARKTHGEGMALAVEFLLRTGLRISEALGQTGADVRKYAGDWSLFVERQLPSNSKDDGTLKSVTSERRVPVAKDLADRLRKSGAEPIVATAMGEPMTADRFRDRFYEVVAAAAEHKDFRHSAVRVHDLRHTFASTALLRGVPLLTVSRVLGHSSIKITADLYGHISDEGMDVVRDAFSRRIA